jgi:hypothetical protein
LNFKDHLAHVFNFWAKPHGIGSFKQCQIPWMPILTFHPRCCLPGPAASGSGGGKKPLRSPRSGDQGERGPRLPARYGSVPINDVRSNAAGSLSSLIFDKHSFQVYLQFNNTTAAYLQCCRLPMLQAPNNAAVPLQDPSSMLQLPTLQCSRLPTRGDTALQVAPNCNAAAYAAMLQPLALCCRLAEYCLP